MSFARDIDPDLARLWSHGCAVGIDIDHGVSRNTALHAHARVTLSAFNADRVRIQALPARARVRERADRDDGWREAVELAETALARLGGQPGVVQAHR